MSSLLQRTNVPSQIHRRRDAPQPTILPPGQPPSGCWYPCRTHRHTTMTARFHFFGAMTVALVLGGCTSRVELTPAGLAQTDGGTSRGAGSLPSTAPTGSAIPESVSQGPLPLIAPQSLLSTTSVTQNQQRLDTPQDQPSSIQSDPGNPGLGDRPNGDTITAVSSQQDSNENGNDGQSSFGQLSYPAATERELAKTTE
jgi:hypothetical protein